MAVNRNGGFTVPLNHSGRNMGYGRGISNPQPDRYVPITLDTTINGKKLLFPQRTIKDSLHEGFKLLRQLLAAAADNSVVQLVVGPETNVARLLRSGADVFSPLN